MQGPLYVNISAGEGLWFDLFNLAEHLASNVMTFFQKELSTYNYGHTFDFEKGLCTHSCYKRKKILGVVFFIIFLENLFLNICYKKLEWSVNAYVGNDQFLIEIVSTGLQQ